MDFHQVWKEVAGSNSTGLFPELTLVEKSILKELIK
jgi:hypothetical protein